MQSYPATFILQGSRFIVYKANPFLNQRQKYCHKHVTAIFNYFVRKLLKHRQKQLNEKMFSKMLLGYSEVYLDFALYYILHTFLASFMIVDGTEMCNDLPFCCA